MQVDPVHKVVSKIFFALCFGKQYNFYFFRWKWSGSCLQLQFEWPNQNPHHHILLRSLQHHQHLFFALRECRSLDLLYALGDSSELCVFFKRIQRNDLLWCAIEWYMQRICTRKLETEGYSSPEFKFVYWFSAVFYLWKVKRSMWTVSITWLNWRTIRFPFFVSIKERRRRNCLPLLVW